MVWFQCEDCGEELKKPKLPNHFRMCSATKLSCIDCGVTFGQGTVQGHTQCMTEAEKYGPKGQGKTPNGKPSKPSNGQQKPDFDINVGLSNRPPWFCSLCNTNTTSKQTLLLHAEGKKHKAKARAFHASKQQDRQVPESAFTDKDSTQSTTENEPSVHQISEFKKENDLLKPAPDHDSLPEQNGNVSHQKKRKMDSSENNGLADGKVNGIQVAEEYETAKEAKKVKHDVEKEDEVTKTTMHDSSENATKKASTKEIKWKKMITSALKSAPDGKLKMKKLRKHLGKALEESGIKVDKTELSNTLDEKVDCSSRFTVEGKYVRLANLRD